MAKNLLKKVLAVGATSALSAAALVGVAAPAHAAGELKIEPNVGSIYAVTADEVFLLKTSFSPGYSSTGFTSQVKYLITDVSATPGSVTFDAAASATATSVDEKSEVTTDVLLAADTDNKVALDAADAAISYLGLAVNGTGTGSTYAAKVQAFVDSNGNSAIDSGEWTSAEQTITFLKHSAVSFDVDITGNNQSASTVDVNVTSSNINIAMMPNDVDTTGSRFLVKVSTSSDVTSGGVFLEYDATDERLEKEDSTINVGSLVAGGTVKAEVFLYDGTITTTLATAVANKSTATALATRIEQTATPGLTSLDGTATVANDVVTSTSTGANPDTATAKSGSGSFTVKVAGTYASGKSSDTVSIKIDETGVDTLKAAGTVTVNGLTLTNSSAGTEQKIETTATTDADGDAYITVSYAGLEAGDTFDITATRSGVTAPDPLRITIADAVATKIYNTNAIGTNVSATRGQLVVPVGSPVNLTYALTDQFGALWSKAGAYVTATEAGGKASTASFVNGYATVSLSAYSAATSLTVTTATFDNGTAVVTTEATTSVKVGTAGVPAAVTATGDAGTTAASTVTALNLLAQSAADTRIGQDGPTAPTTNSNSTISGTVTDANLNGIAADVTLTAENVMFVHDDVYSLGSITVRSTSAGAYSVEAYSNIAGKKVITVTAGAASASEEIWWPAAAASAGTTLTISAPEYVLPASTLQITATLTDKFGNPVEAGGTNTTAAGEDFAVTYVGPGLLVGSAPTKFDANGQAKLNYLLGANDKGTISVTFKYDQNGTDLDFTDTLDLVTTKTITIGEDPGETKVNAGSFKGYVAVYARGYEGHRLSAKVGKDWVVVPSIVNNQENGTLFRVVEYTGAGYDISVRIYIDRVLMDTIALTTK